MLDLVEKQEFNDSHSLTNADKNCSDTPEPLVSDAINGDQQAFSALMNQYYADIYRFSFHLTKNKTQAEDLTHDVCLKVARSIHQFKFDSRFKSWVYRIVINTHKDNFKKQANQAKRDSYYHEQTVLNQRHQQPEETIEYNELLSAIDKLPEKLKLTLILVHAQQLTHSQVSDVLACSTSTVSWRIHEAKKQLKKILKEQS